MGFNEKTVKENYIYKGKILSLKNDVVELDNGKKANREIVEHLGGSAILCVKDNKVLLEKQFRYAYKKVLWEIPAGKLNVGEDPMQTAVRELEEECGIKATKVSFLAEVYPSPGYTKEIIRIFKVEDFVSSTTNFDEDEFLECEWVDLSTAKQMIKNGDIKDAKTLIALLSVL